MKQNKSIKRTTCALSLIFSLISSAGVSAATTTFGTPLIVQVTGPVSAQFVGGASAGFDNELYLDSPSSIGPIFNNHTSTPGDTVNLGNFTAGDELIFRNRVVNTITDYFTGPGSRNPDGQIHAAVTEGLTDADLDVLEAANSIANGTFVRGGVLVGFEDLLANQWGGGEPDYNDLSYWFTNLGTAAPSPVPIPAAVWLFGSGLLGLIGIARRRQARMGTTAMTSGPHVS